MISAFASSSEAALASQSDGLSLVGEHELESRLAARNLAAVLLRDCKPVLLRLDRRLGWIAAFIYCVGAALRLARFNTNIEVVDKRFFQGLPSPAAAALIAGFVWVLMDLNYTGEEVRWYAWA